jgi:Transcription factor WhiB
MQFARYDPTKGSSRDYVWSDDANCAGMDPEKFWISSPGDPEVEDLNHMQVNEYNKEKVIAAMAVCHGCPVREQCLKEATSGDRFWSVRGGEQPGRMGWTGKKKTSVPSWDMSDYKSPWSCPKHGDEHRVTHVRKERKSGYEVYCGKCRSDR